VFENCLTVVMTDGTVTVARLASELELDHRAGDVISDGEGGLWRVEEVFVEQRHLVVSVAPLPADQSQRAAPDRLAA
jgi:hypothetical protein